MCQDIFEARRQRGSTSCLRPYLAVHLFQRNCGLRSRRPRALGRGATRAPAAGPYARRCPRRAATSRPWSSRGRSSPSADSVRRVVQLQETVPGALETVKNRSEIVTGRIERIKTGLDLRRTPKSSRGAQHVLKGHQHFKTHQNTRNIFQRLQTPLTVARASGTQEAPGAPRINVENARHRDVTLPPANRLLLTGDLLGWPHEGREVA